MGCSYSVRHAAVLVEQLPIDSRTARAARPHDAVGTTDRLLALIEYDLRVLDYHFMSANTDKRGRSRLEAPEPPLFARKPRQKVASYEIEELERILNLPRKEED